MVITSLMIAAAVAVLVGIAVVSTGYGGELAPADPLLPGAVLPADGPLASADLEEVRFSIGIWGHPPAEVEQVLDRAARALAERDARIADLEHRLFARQLHGEASMGERGHADGAEESW